eukprot:jgi/Tetstr1/459482/TSEL_004849.t1
MGRKKGKKGRAGKAGGGKPPGLTGHSPAPSVTPTESEADTTDLDEDEALGEEQQEQQEQVELEEEEQEQEEVVQAARAEEEEDAEEKQQQEAAASAAAAAPSGDESGAESAGAPAQPTPAGHGSIMDAAFAGETPPDPDVSPIRPTQPVGESVLDSPGHHLELSFNERVAGGREEGAGGPPGEELHSTAPGAPVQAAPGHPLDPDPSAPEAEGQPGMRTPRALSLLPTGSPLQMPSPLMASDTDFIVLAAEVERLEGELAESQHRWRAAEAQLRGLQEASSQAHEYQQKMARLEAAVQGRDAQLVALQQERGELHKEATRLKERVVEVRKETRREVQKAEMDAVAARLERAERALEHERNEKIRVEKQLAEARGTGEAGAAALEEIGALKEQLRDTQTELDTAQEELAAETAMASAYPELRCCCVVDKLKEQLNALLATGDAKLKEHADMSAELTALREFRAQAEGDTAALQEELEGARLAARAAEIKAANADTLSLDLQSKCQSLGETLGKMIEENTELADVLNRRAVQAAERAAAEAGAEAGGAKEDGGGGGSAEGEAAVEAAGQGGSDGEVLTLPEGGGGMGEGELQLLVLAEEVGRLEGALEEERAKLAALAEAAAGDDAELGALRARVRELEAGQAGGREGPEASAAAEEEDEDKQHAAMLALHREVTNLKAELAESRSQLRRAGLGPAEADRGQGAAVGGADTVAIGILSDRDYSVPGGEVHLTGGEAGATERQAEPEIRPVDDAANHIAPEHPAQRPPPRRSAAAVGAKDRPAAGANASGGGLWGFISGAP